MSMRKLAIRAPRTAAALWMGTVLTLGGLPTADAQSTLSDASGKPAPSTVTIGRDGKTQKLTMAAGKSTIVDLPAEASEIFVGNPAVANAVVRSARRLYVMAVGNGQTTIFALDKQGRQIATLELIVSSRDLTALKSLLDAAIPTNEIQVRGINDNVILTGSVASALDAQKAQDIANAYVGYTTTGGGGANSSGGTSINFSSSFLVNGQLINALTIRGHDQVMVKVQVIEIQREIVKQLGINLGGSWTSSSGSGFTAQPSGTPAGVNGIPTPYSGGLNSAFNITSGSNFLSSSIQAFERNGVAHTLAEPAVAAISGETASFKAGGTVPVPSSSSIDTNKVCTVQYTQQNYGVELDFTPTVLSDGRISLHMTTIVSEPDGMNSQPGACATILGFKSRSNTTTLELPSGGSIVSAGLIQKASQQAIAGTPGLMNLPILGALFRSRDYQRNESELMIIVTPYLVKSIRPDQVSKPDDGFTDATDPQSWLLGRVNKIYSTADNPELVHRYRGHVGFITD